MGYTVRVPVNPNMLRWARERAGQDLEDLQKKFPKIAAWERGESQPTLKQLEQFARAVHVSFGLLFLDAPPEETFPLPDFRTFRGACQRPSPNLLDTIYICQQRQEWYRDYLQSLGEAPLAFVGSASLRDQPRDVAEKIRASLGFDVEARRKMPSWEDALRLFIEQADALGILVIRSGVVEHNPHRKLDPQEFLGFAISDALAPLIFLNGAGTKAAQMFTLAHEIAHLWLGQSAVSDASPAVIPEEPQERWCNQVAAELLVPMAVLQEHYRPRASLPEESQRLAGVFKVSTLVILRRLFEMGALERETFWQVYRAEEERLRALAGSRASDGGDFYRTLNVLISKRFAEAVVLSALQGQTLFRDAFQLLGVRKQETFDKFARTLGVL
jgi:Zn-dependent peptidase ImmA (M78 family)